MTAPTQWSIQPGDELIRAEIHPTYGGSDQNGIAPSRQTANILIYSDHEKAIANGYDYDGWDTGRDLFFYTGEGPEGDQEFTRGNKAIRDHQADGRALRLFVATGNKPGTGTRLHQYVGQFALDPELPYVERVAPGRDGIPRKVIIFRLRPAGEVLTSASQTSTIEGAGAAAVVSAVAVDAVPVEAKNTEQSEFERTGSVVAVQKEAQLTARFQSYLESHGRKVKRYRIVPTASKALYSDLADVTGNVLYEAKGTAERMSVRLALGQVLDYGRYVGDSRLAILLPEPPAADLVELLERYDVGCVVEGKDGEFIDMTALERCP